MTPGRLVKITRILSFEPNIDKIISYEKIFFIRKLLVASLKLCGFLRDRRRYQSQPRYFRGKPSKKLEQVEGDAKTSAPPIEGDLKTNIDITSKCTIDGKEVPCAEAVSFIKKILLFIRVLIDLFINLLDQLFLSLYQKRLSDIP